MWPSTRSFDAALDGGSFYCHLVALLICLFSSCSSSILRAFIVWQQLRRWHRLLGHGGLSILVESPRLGLVYLLPNCLTLPFTLDSHVPEHPPVCDSECIANLWTRLRASCFPDPLTHDALLSIVILYCRTGRWGERSPPRTRRPAYRFLLPPTSGAAMGSPMAILFANMFNALLSEVHFACSGYMFAEVWSCFNDAVFFSFLSLFLAWLSCII